MPDSITHLPPIRQQEQYTSAITGRTNTIEIDSVKMHVLEMEDVLFHLASAMMMPQNPAGKSSSQGTANAPGSAQASNQAQQAALSGIEALALAFKQLEFNPDLKTLIAAHADTSGDIQYNFSLSKDRGRNVHAILTGSEDEWVASVARSTNPNTQPDRHKIEDYQQVLTWVSLEKSWDCDPLGIDNSWGPNTENAVKVFLEEAGNEFLLLENTEEIFLDIKNHPRKLWPESALRVIYRLYNEKITRVLGETPAGMESRRGVLRGSFLHQNIPIVPCGEAFPIDAAERNNYRSQQNRRVEVIFFDQEDLAEFTPAMLEAQCPLEMKKSINSGTFNDYKAKCPIWPFRKHFAPLYIDPSDLNAVVYHLRFVYWDRILSKIMEVPSGLNIETYRDGVRIDTVTKWNNGVYSVKVRFPAPLPATPPADFHFEFKTTDSWIFTDNNSATPQIIVKVSADIDAMKPADRWKYHDLPPLWNSKGFIVRYNCTTDNVATGADKRGDYIEVVKTTVGLKPFGTAITSNGSPLTFCFEDIVLTNQLLTPIPDGSGVGALLGMNLDVLDPDTGNTKDYYTKGGVPSRRIPFQGKRVLGVLFERKIYAVFQDRVTDPSLAGHRAAVFIHKKQCTLVTNFQQRHYRDYHNIGNFDAYLLRGLDFINGRQISFIFNYFRWHCEDASTHTLYAQDWANTTFKNLTDEWNNAANNQLVHLLYTKDADNVFQINIRYYIEHVAKPNQHTIILVHPAGTPGRSYMSIPEGAVRANQNVRDAHGRFTAAHEFGHAQSLDDDYHENANNCSYWQLGFVDFKPGAPFVKDSQSMMESNKVVRSRHYWHFAAWLYKEFESGQNIEFTLVKKNEIDFKLALDPANTGDPRDMSKESRIYCNYPAVTIRNATNDKNSKGKFDLHLYPLGPDPFSQGGLKRNNNFSGIITLPVNLRFKFWNSADYDDIVDILDKIDTGIQENLIKKLAIKVKGNAPYSDTFIVPQPRYLVENYTAGFAAHLNSECNTSAAYAAKITWITAKPEAKTHYNVNVTAPVFGSLLSSSTWSGSTLELIKGDAEKFWRYFCEMLGLANKELPTKDNFSVASAVPGGTMESC